MAVDRERRLEIARNFASLMRGETRPREIVAMRRRLFQQRNAVNDSLARHALNRLDKHWWGTMNRRRLQCTELQWQKLQRWIAILHTDIDWEQPRPPIAITPDSRLSTWGSDGWGIGCVALPATIATMIGAAYVFDGTPLIVWTVIACLVMPVILTYLLCQPQQVTEWDRFKPFSSVEEMDASMHFLDFYNLPAFEAGIHGVHPSTKVIRFLISFPFLMMLVVAMSILWPWALLTLWIERREKN